MSLPTKKLRKDSKIKFVGYESDTISSAKLPTVRQVLSYFCYKVRPSNVSTRNAAWATIEVVSAIWKNTKIPLLREMTQVEKVEKLYKEWLTVCKHSSRANAVAKFESGLDKTFVISKSDALDLMEMSLHYAKSEDVKTAYLEDIEFLKDQRDGPRLFVFGGVDLKMTVKEVEDARRLAKWKENQLRNQRARQTEPSGGNAFNEDEAGNL